ncbi:unnamed protein product [Cuscuta campestris]|uniref:Uncharacterized protein n=1 Tax=Cuscuta campestris TaxID=132261 RepID=A0A484MN48_9ASTE|nr:unnamed protein product [Cuscuta campestris]
MDLGPLGYSSNRNPKSIGSVPEDGKQQHKQDAYEKHVKDDNQVSCVMLATMITELQKQHENMKAHEMIVALRQLYQGQSKHERFLVSKALFSCKLSSGNPVGFSMQKELATDLILQSLPELYKGFCWLLDERPSSLLAPAVLPGGTGCESFLFFKGRTGRKFISDVPQSNRGWKEKFVFIEFPPYVTPLANLKWNDHLLNHEYTVPASSPDLEASLKILLRGDPFTGRKFHYESWVWRIQLGGEGTSQAHEAAGHGVPSPGNTAEAEGQNHQVFADMEFDIPDDQPMGETGDSQAASAKTFTVQPETMEIHDEDEPHDDRSKGKGKEKAGKRTKKVATTHPSYAKKRARSDSDPASQTIEEAFINLGVRLQEAGLSGMAGTMRAEITQLKEENCRLLDEVSGVKQEMTQKEDDFPGRAAAWVKENKAEAARAMTASPEATMESFRLLDREPEGKKMITAIGSFGFKSGQKKDRAASHRILKKRDPDFTVASYGLAPIPEEEPTPPFPLD